MTLGIKKFITKNPIVDIAIGVFVVIVLIVCVALTHYYKIPHDTTLVVAP